MDVLDAYYTECEWDTDLIEDAFRLGKKENAKGARPILVKFYDVGTARKILGLKAGRDRMAKEEGIKVAQERTRLQDKLLRQYRAEGKNPYLFRGQIRFREGGGRDNFAPGPNGKAREDPPMPRSNSDHNQRYLHDFPSLPSDGGFAMNPRGERRKRINDPNKAGKKPSPEKNKTKTTPQKESAKLPPLSDPRNQNELTHDQEKVSGGIPRVLCTGGRARSKLPPSPRPTHVL